MTQSRNGRFVLSPPDETTISLRAKVRECLQPPVNPRAAEFWQEVLADHIRNQHRKAAGLDPIIKRWDRNAPEMRVVTVPEDVAA